MSFDTYSDANDQLNQSRYEGIMRELKRIRLALEALMNEKQFEDYRGSLVSEGIEPT